MDFSEFPPVDEPLKRLSAYQKERERVEEALAKKPEERTRADWNIIADSPYGTGNPHNF